MEKRLFVVGMGPGGGKGLTFEGYEALEAAEILVGYSKYIQLIQPLFPEKETYATGMTQEIQRCREAFRLADEGRTVGLVCSGDAGVYGMAGPALELSSQYSEVAVKVVPGVTAALAGAAVLGAPLTHDFAVISLSDLLTPWEKIAQRLRCAAMADFCIALYNPSSSKRADYLQKACDILLEYKKPETCCGLVRRIGRDGQQQMLLSLDQLRETQVDMFTTVFIGNEQTRQLRDKLVTPRGYRID